MNAQEINRFISKFTGVERDYFHCLNACAEFEKGLTRDQMIKYTWLIGEQQQRSGEWTTYDVAQAIHATAEQRCRAFVAVHEGKEK